MHSVELRGVHQSAQSVELRGVHQSAHQQCFEKCEKLCRRANAQKLIDRVARQLKLIDRVARQLKFSIAE